MYGTREAERIAEQAWDHLVSAVDTAGDSAKGLRKRTKHLADEAGGKVGSAADEAARRASNALDALAGRRQPPAWLWIAGAVAAGAAFGWAAAVAARRAVAMLITEEEPEALEILDEPVAVRPVVD